MAEGVLGLGGGQASTLNNELINKLKTAERVSTVKPIETALTNWDTEKETLGKIKVKLDAFLEAVKPLDLFSTGSNAFSQISANSSGTSVRFDAEDLNILKEGTTDIKINSLAKRDVYQSTDFASKTGVVPGTDANDKISITHDGTTYDFNTNGKTYEELTDEINANPNFEATIEKVGTDKFRMVIKSKELGLTNALSISQTGLDLGLNLSANHVQTASNLDAEVDGVKYDLSSNQINLSNGLSVTALKVDGVDEKSSITIAKDTSKVEAVLKDFAAKYNDLVATVNAEVYSSDSKIGDKASLRTMMDNIKGVIFDQFGTTSDGSGGFIKDKSVFNFGFDLAKDGSLSVNSKDLNKAIKDDFQGLKDLFAGSAETDARGLGTQLKEYIDQGINSSSGGIYSSYEDNMDIRKKTLEADKIKAIESLDNKYSQLSSQFASYNVIINRMESSFAGLKLMIAQSSN